MSRISSYSANTTLINQMLRTQQRLFDLETQVTSEKKSQDYLGIAVNAQRLVNLENTKSQLDRFINNNTQAEVRLSIEATVVEGIQETVKEFKSALQEYETSNGSNEERVEEVQAAAFRALRSIQTLLNTDVAGRFIFSGSRVTNEPVELGISSITAFQELFNGDTVKVPTTRDGTLERFSFSSDENNLTTQYVDPANFLVFAQDADGNTATSSNSSISATSALFSNVAVGSTIKITDTASNNGTYTVASVTNSGRTIEINTSMLTDELNVPNTSIGYRDPNNPTNELLLTSGSYGTLTFNRAANTIVAQNAGSLSALQVGARITVGDSTQNDGDYTVASNNGTTVTVVSNKLTDEGNGAGNLFFDYHAGTQVVFTANGGTNDDTIAVQQNGGGGAVPDVFNGLAVGDTVTVANTGSNNTTYTVNAISADGSTITVNESVTNETDFNATFTGSNSFAHTVGTQINFNAATETIEIQDTGGTAVPGAFSQLKAGMQFTVSGVTTNNGVFTVASVAANGSSVTVTQDITVNETDNDGARVRSFAAAGTIAATPYYAGDTVTTTHRTSELRSYENELTAIDPAFEKAIRGMMIILQGKYGTAGGLDENQERVSQAKYLIESSLEFTVSGTPPFGTELTSSIEQVQQNIGFNQVLLSRQNALHNDFIGFIESSVADIENADPLATITRLLDDQRSLEASYQTFARIRQLSLTNFL
jgi:flagellar hook-associated protein 3 FlgL